MWEKACWEGGIWSGTKTDWREDRKEKLISKWVNLTSWRNSWVLLFIYVEAYRTVTAYCNSLLCRISDTLLRRLQSVQNAAAHVITRTPSHYTDLAPSTLATSATASGIQACCSGVQGNEQSSTRIPVAGLLACRRHRSARAPVVTQLHLCEPLAHGLAIVRSLPPDHHSGTVCQQMSVGPTSQSKVSAGSWRRICLVKTPAPSDCCA